MNCQSCGAQPLTKVLSLGYMPPVNLMQKIGEEPQPQMWLPTDLYYCEKCELVQLECIADPDVVFPKSYPYTSGSTRILRDNFVDLAEKCEQYLEQNDTVVDIGSNDGTLLANFADRYRTFGVEPTDVAYIAQKKGIKTWQSFFSEKFARQMSQQMGGLAKLVTCTNCFAHVPDVHGFIRGVKTIMRPDGIFVTESHYLIDLMRSLQYDTIYHEHLRYYSLTSLRNLLAMHGLKIFKHEFIPTHGGSIRVYASMEREEGLFIDEPTGLDMLNLLTAFEMDVADSKRKLVETLYNLKVRGNKIVGIGAPSRASTVVSYCRIDHSILDYVCEIKGSMKIGRYMPGTSIPVVDESRLFHYQPDYAVIFSWHIADEIIASLRKKGYRGKFIMPVEGEYAQAA